MITVRCKINILHSSYNLLAADLCVSKSKTLNDKHILPSPPALLIEILSTWNYNEGARSFEKKIKEAHKHGTVISWVVHPKKGVQVINVNNVSQFHLSEDCSIPLLKDDEVLEDAGFFNSKILASQVKE